MTWAPQDAQELQGIRLALQDIRDVLMSQASPNDEPVDSDTCPFCLTKNVHDLTEFGAEPDTVTYACGQCGTTWTRVAADAA